MTEPVRPDAEPSKRRPAGALYVPVRPGSNGCTARLFRTPVGVRTAVGFTSRRQLADALGADQPWIRLGAPALRALTEPLGAVDVTVDPKLAVKPGSGPAPTRSARPAPVAARDAAPPRVAV
jgi:hypothetical protein